MAPEEPRFRLAGSMPIASAVKKWRAFSVLCCATGEVSCTLCSPSP